MKICLLCEGVASTAVRHCAACGSALLLTSEVHFPARRGEEDATHPLLGTLIDGKYRVTGVLGRGGMGTVFRATHEVSLVPIALKLLHPRLAARPEYRAQFLAEARKAGRVVHEHTARVLDVGEMQDGSIFLAQELVPGRTLHDWLHAVDRLSAAATLQILRQVAAALAAAHAVGLVHRDLTPRNIMIDVRAGQPHVKVLDFGIARGSAERGGGDDGLAGFATPPYASPEHLSGGEIDGRADLYSLGVIAYEALCGQLPTAGASAREFAVATLNGELQPIVPRERVPGWISRLVRSLLARDPDGRPPSAQDVVEQLSSLSAPRGGWFRVAALLALLVATTTFAITYREPTPPPFLRLLPNQVLELLPTMPRGAPVQELRSADLAALRFEFGYFDPRRLTAEIWQNGESVAQRLIGSEQAIQASGSTLLLQAGDPAHTALLEVLRGCSREGPVHVNFGLPGRPRTTLAAAALRLDDAAPELALRLRGARLGGVVNAASVFDATIQERRLVRLAIEVEGEGLARSIDLDVAQREFPADVLRGVAPPPLALRQARVRLTGVDAAGNSGASGFVAADRIDLGVPRVVRVSGAHGDARSLVLGVNGVRLRIELEQREPDLQVAFGPFGGDAIACQDVVEAGQGIEAVWPIEPTSAPPDGRYDLVVRDLAGNTSTYTDSFTFASVQLDPSLSVSSPADAESGRGALTAHGLFTDGAPLQLAFRCNRLYRPDSLGIVGGDGAPLPPNVGLQLDEVADGAARVSLPSLADGRYRIVLHVRSVAGDRLEWIHALFVRREPMALRVPAAGARRYLPQLQELGLVAVGAGDVGPGPAWSLDPPDARWLRGVVWFGSQSITARPLAECDVPAAPLFAPIRPLSGECVLALTLRDVLDRAVEVRCGDRLATPLLGLRDPRGEPALEVARFVWHEAPPRVRGGAVGVEFGQPARLIVDAPVAYAAGDAIELDMDATPVRPKSIEAREGGGVALEFELPFERLVTVARLADLSPDDFARERTSEPIPMWLSAPDGRHPLEVRVRTRRTTLEPVRLETVGATALPAALRGIVMVPVLGPGVGRPWRDPVAPTVADRAAFRAVPRLDVRNVDDCYLQQHELSRGQYWQVATAIVAAHARGELSATDALVHFGDPVGAERLRLVNLVPRTHQGDQAGWQAMVARAPDAAVAGVDFFQAFCVARACGWLLARDPNLFRLPFGVEMELAALGSNHEPGRTAPLNGAARAGGLRRSVALAGRDDPAAWPLSAAASAAAGDRLVTDLGMEMTGLDFGVREWVGDLPLLPTERGGALVEVQRSDHSMHLDAVAQLGRGQATSGMIRAMLQFGMVRGLASDELSLDPAAPPPTMPGRVGADVAGVVRLLQLARDGHGTLPDELDPHLGSIGFRLAGGREFRMFVRGR